MATEASDIGVESSNYHGDANLGGGDLGVIKLDTKPLEELAAYTFTYNKAMYEQKQKDIEAKAKQYADLTAYDLTTAIPGDRDKIQKGYNDLYNYVKNDPTVLEYKDNEKGWLEYNKKKNEFENQLQSGKVRSVLYAGRQNEIAAATNPLTKAYLQKKLDDEASSTDLMTPLKHTELYDIAPVAIEPPPSRKLDFTKISPNFIGQRTYDLPDMASVGSQASALALGFSKGLDETSDDFKSKTPEQQQLLRDQNNAQTASGRLEPVESAKNISSVLQNPKYQDQKYRNADGSLNIDAVIKDNSGNGVLTGVLTTVKQYNDKMHEMKGAVTSGLKDNLGKVLSFGAGGLNENDYRDIDLKDGLSPEELLKTRILGAAKPIDYSTKITQTNQAIDQQNANTTSGHLYETIRHNKATEGQQVKEAQDAVDKWKAASTGSETQLNGAMIFAKAMYADMQKLADKNGVITPDKLRQLNNTQLKYLGIEKPVKNAAGNVSNVFAPLDFKGKDAEGNSVAVPHAIQLVNGEIRVLSDAKISDTGSGSYKGLWDPNKSTNIQNIATNRLNEENKASGAKERNAYVGIDVTGTSTADQSGGGTSESGGSSQSSSGSGSDAVTSITGQVDPATLKVGSTYSVSGKKYVWNGTKLKAK